MQTVADRIAEVLAQPVHSPSAAELVDATLLENPWVSFAVEVRLLERSAERAHAALARYRELEPFLSELELQDKALRYVAEARRTYLLGLDAACVAFCGAALEQILKEVLRPLPASGASLEKMIDIAAERDQITASTAAAHMLRRQRNHVMHTGLWEERVESNVAAQAIRNLGAVLQELGGR